MFKNSFFIFFSALTLFMAGGCGEESTGSVDEQEAQEEQTEHEEEKQAEDIQESEETDENESEEESEAEKEAEEEESQSPDEDLEEVSEKTEEPEEEQVQETEEEQPEKEEISSELTAHFIDAGQADSTLLEFEDNGQPVRILIDAGNWNSDNVINYLHSRNIEQIDIAVGTHPDADHIGQMDQVISRFNVGEVWMSGNESTSETYERVLDSIESSGTEYDEPRAGDTFDIGPLTIETLYPETVTGNTNRESLSFKMSYGEVDFLFTGDAEAEEESRMLNGAANVEAEILQLGHHGSSTSTSAAFLQAVDPEAAIYSAGESNQYGHPSAEVVQRVQEAGIELYGTDVHGTVEVTTDGENYDITTEKEGNVTSASEEESESDVESSEGEAEEEQEAAEPTGNCVDINSASIEEVQEITQIGPARAEDLIELRPYQSVDDLTKINGIGPARIDEIKAQGVACVGG
ncbi:competence protein ComEC [Halobacillus andaensis]|uniref:Competence protein ComEC n=1 Tax=Halobacillus andaensis TaxID=1176239 RepID=A0A917B3D2_HALAA|nr:MBL fold metallo-hydrolase [Halobacillus andaensis]MBP2004754.1 competence ComEA-like helix-hairpin-helix protein [Halobacillus andaensis]GGF19182.1 competence protein ComEC [Halobacillus andaensis]